MRRGDYDVGEVATVVGIVIAALMAPQNPHPYVTWGLIVGLITYAVFRRKRKPFQRVRQLTPSHKSESQCIKCHSPSEKSLAEVFGNHVSQIKGKIERNAASSEDEELSKEKIGAFLSSLKQDYADLEKSAKSSRFSCSFHHCLGCHRCWDLEFYKLEVEWLNADVTLMIGKKDDFSRNSVERYKHLKRHINRIVYILDHKVEIAI